eukprot:gene6361-10367_t
MNLSSVLVSVVISALITLHSYLKKKSSLNLSGAIAAFFVGCITFHGGLYFTTILLVFFFSSSRLTKYKSEIKKQREDGYEENQGRNYIQVLANGGLPTLICFIYQFFFYHETFELETTNFLKKFLLICYLGIYSSNCGDTWSSEVGILSKNKPFHILYWKTVPYGTNGGVSKLGLLASLVAGVSLGIITSLVMVFSRRIQIQSVLLLLVVCSFSSVFGSLLDSVLGGIFEYSGYCKEKKKIVKIKTSTTKDISGFDLLSGDSINFISGGITGIITGIVACWF